jgi:hypothetical protein
MGDSEDIFKELDAIAEEFERSHGTFLPDELPSAQDAVALLRENSPIRDEVALGSSRFEELRRALHSIAVSPNAAYAGDIIRAVGVATPPLLVEIAVDALDKLPRDTVISAISDNLPMAEKFPGGLILSQFFPDPRFAERLSELSSILRNRKLLAVIEGVLREMNDLRAGLENAHSAVNLSLIGKSEREKAARMNAALKSVQMETALRESEVAFREHMFTRVISLLAPYEEMLPTLGRTRLAYCRRKAEEFGSQ